MKTMETIATEGGNDDDGGWGEESDEEFRPLLNFEVVMKQVEAHGDRRR